MKRGLFITSAMVLLLVFLVQYAASGNQKAEAVSQEQIRQNMHRIQIPFIANNGQMDERVTFYANTFGGTVFVTKDGEIVYALPNNSSDVETQGIASLKHSPDVIHDAGFETQDNHEPCVKPCRLGEACPEPAEWTERTQQISDLHSPTSNSQTHNSKLVNSELQGIALKETLIGAKVKEIKGEDKSATKINYFKGNDQKKWKSNISTYDVVDLGEVYKGIELKLKAYGSNVEKLFYVKPGANPDQIKINLSGIQPPESPFSKGDLVESLSTIGSTDASQHSTAKLLSTKESIMKSPLEKGGRGVVSPDEPGTSGLWINEQGQLVAETELGPVTFTKPVAYQEIDGKRVDVAVEYEIYAVPQVVHRNDAKNAKESIVGNTENAGNVCPPLACLCVARRQAGVKGVERDSPHVIQPTTNPKSKRVNLSSTEIGCPKLEYGFKVASYDKTKELVIDPLLASTYLGGSDYDYGYSISLDTSGNVYVTGHTGSSDFPTTVGVYDTSFNDGDYDVFVSKLDGELTSLLASTYLGGSDYDRGCSLALDTNGNVYVTGYSYSNDYPTTTGAYQTSNSGSCNVIVSKLDSDLTTLLASTYIGGSYVDKAYSIAIDSSGNVYVTGDSSSSNYPTTTGVYQTIFNHSSGDNDDIIISKLDGNLSNLLASTYLGGESSDEGISITLDGSDNVYITGNSSSEIDYPTTTGAYKTGYFDNVIVSKLNSDLTSLLASTYFGGDDDDYGNSIALDNNGNIYITGYSKSSDYPTTTNAYQTSKKSNYWDIIISKLNNDLTALLASTYIGGSTQDYGASLAVDSSGNVYITGYSYSSDYPTTTGAYQTSYSGSLYDVIVSKLNSDLTTLNASTYLGGNIGYAIALDKTGDVYVIGYTDSSNFTVSSDGYDNSFNGGSNDIFVSKLDSDLSASPPSVTTDSATDITINSATLNGTVNANNRSTTVWFEYGLYSDLYDYSTSTKTISGSSDQTVSVDISNLYAGTKYYYRIVAENEIGTTYGDEMSFTTLSDTTKPSGSININSGNSYTSSANVTLKLSASDDVGITGYYISTNSSTPSSSTSGWTSISSTTNYSASISYTLDGGDGSKTIYVWYKDGGGNISNTHSDSITVDTTPPEINITSPTSNDTYSTNISVVSVWGNASDATSGISTVKWENNKGGSGTASGTTSWSISNIGLLVDAENIITVTATDNAGNSASDSITVIYSELTAEPTATSTTTPTPVQKPSPATTIPVNTPTTTPTPAIALQGKIFGYVMDEYNTSIESVKVTCKGKNTGVKVKEYTNKEGYFEFNNLNAGTYKIVSKKKGYYKSKYNVNLEEGEEKEIEMVLEEK